MQIDRTTKHLPGRIFETREAAITAAEKSGFTLAEDLRNGGRIIYARRGFLGLRLVARRYGAFHEWVE